MRELFELTRRLIDIPSVTGAEGAVSRFLASHLAGLGYEVETQEIAPRRSNVLARVAGSRARVVLSTHTDTVPPHVASSEDDEFVHGRGACDAKGIIAAQIAAAETLRADGVREIGLLFTVDEEMGSDGARAANRHEWARDCRFLVNGEPTDNRLAAGTKGSLRVRLSARGREAHSAYPERGESAIEKLLDVLARIRAHAWPRDDFFGETTCNVGTLSGGTRPNVVAAEAAADLQFRLVASAREVKESLERIAAGRVQVEYLSENEPMRLTTVEGFEQEVVRFTTDIPYLASWGAPLLCGPGSILVAHTLEERVAKRELAEAVGIYARLARTLLARAGGGAHSVGDARDGAGAGGAAR
ncbi:MAG: M20/M25/M40 family metallo-hydrolase [Acidobacteria bacterium]|nr:M20/M25/M40 family metallo-hydrolase [Acidobacteriota bacterium]MCA1641114.1 M20/M25/M40 family metallo-hydrolase [Acidobacteriota bacterium]